ncbi:MAG: preprotein translocase subunit YajC [Acidimicrobiales bacterium]|nr:preprotein translocase subunit YajC [Acidimicrobiales bacterium]
MEPLIVLAVTFVLLWVIFILPQQRRVRAHQALVASVQPGDQVVLSAGIYGRIVEVGPEDMTIEVAPGVELRVARQAVLRVVEDATAAPAAGHDDAAGAPQHDVDGLDDAPEPTAGGGADAPDAPDPDDRGPAAPGPNV